MPRPDSGVLSGILAGIQQFKQTRAFYEQMETSDLQQERYRAQMGWIEQQRAGYESPADIDSRRYKSRLDLEDEIYNRTLARQPAEDERRLTNLEEELKLRSQYAPQPASGRGPGGAGGGYGGAPKPGDISKLDEIMGETITALGFTEQDFPGVRGLPEHIHRQALAQLQGGYAYDKNGNPVQVYPDRASAITTLYAGLLEIDPQIKGFAARMATDEELESDRLPAQVSNTIAGMAQRRLPITQIRREIQRMSFEQVPAEPTQMGTVTERIVAQPMTSLQAIVPFGKALGGSLLSDAPWVGDKASSIRDEGFRNLLDIHGDNIQKSIDFLMGEGTTSDVIQEFIGFLVRIGRLDKGTAAEAQGIPAANIESRP